MDLLSLYLRLYMIILRAKTERDGVPRRYLVEKKETKSMSTKFQGVGEAMKKLKSKADDVGKELLDRINAASTRMDSAKEKAHGTVSLIEAQAKEIEDFVDSLEGANGGPPLDDSAKPAQG